MAPADGDRAPQAALPRLGGGTIEIPGAGPLNLVVFWKSSCATCRWALPFFEKLHDGTKGGSLAVTGVAEDTEEDARATVEALGLGFPHAVETEPWDVSRAYDLVTVPTFVLVDGEGRLVMTSPGFARDDILDVARRAAELDGTEPVDPFAGEEVPAYRPG